MTSKPSKVVQQPAPSNNLNPHARYIHVLTILLLGFAVRLWLIHSYPLLFGADGVMRLAHSHQIVLAYQLPLLQAAIHALSLLSNDPLWVRYLMAGIGAVAGVGFYYLTASLLGSRIGFYAALLFVSNPFVLAYSIVPYQEILMLAGLFWGFYFFFKENWWGASLSLGLACLTRYEAWAACPVLVLAFAAQRGFSVRRLFQGAALFGWAPLAWMASNAGIAPAGTFVLDLGVNLERLWRYVYLGWITAKNTPIPALLLALFGFWRFWKQRMLRSPRYRMLLAFLVLFLLAVLVSAHGERDQPERFVTAREAHLLLAAVTVCAGLGLSRLQRFQMPVVVLSVVVGFFMADRFVARETADPHLQLAYQLAQFLDVSVAPDEHAVILAKPIPRELVAGFLRKNERRAGVEGRRRAVKLLRELDALPLDYLRTVVHSRLGKDQIHSLSTLPLEPGDDAHSMTLDRRSVLKTDAPDWVAVWSDFAPSNEAESELQHAVRRNTPAETLQAGTLEVRVYRLR